LTLFHRRPDGYELTRQGQVILDFAETMRGAAHAIIDYKHNNADQLPRLIRITTTRTLADLWLIRQLGSLRRSRPNVALEILTTNRNLSLARGEADIALRLARPVEGELIARKVASLGYSFYTAASCAPVADARDARFIHYEHGSEVLEAKWLEGIAADRPAALRSSSLLAQCEAAAAGLGIALLPRYLGDADPRIVPLALSPTPPAREIWLITTRRGARSPDIRAVSDELIASFTRDRGLFEGAINGNCPDVVSIAL
jgi:DNA-binding transcriptional LysR family regulator